MSLYSSRGIDRICCPLKTKQRYQAQLYEFFKFRETKEDFKDLLIKEKEE